MTTLDPVLGSLDFLVPVTDSTDKEELTLDVSEVTDSLRTSHDFFSLLPLLTTYVSLVEDRPLDGWDLSSERLL